MASRRVNRSHLLANPTLKGPDGATYRMIIAWFGASPIDALGSSSTLAVLLLIAIVVSAAVCWWIAGSICRPVAKLQLGARALALGNLDAQVDQRVCARRDELGRLAPDFNEMATRLHSQIASKGAALSPHPPEGDLGPGQRGRRRLRRAAGAHRT